MVLVLAASLLGCHAGRGSNPAPHAPHTTTFMVKEATLRDGAISVRLSLPLAPSGPRPVVIGTPGGPHGLMNVGIGSVEYTIHWNRVPAAPADATSEAASVGKWVLASPSAALLGQTYLRRIASTATEFVPAIVDWLQTLEEVDGARIGIAGASTNGFVALQALAAEPRIRAAVAVAACADYRTFLRDSSMGLQGGAPLALAPDYDAWITEQEIIHAPGRVVHAALLMIDYEADPLIPIACAEATAAALRRAYAEAGAAERFEYVRRAQEAHGFTPPDARALVAWFARWLGGSAAR